MNTQDQVIFSQTQAGYKDGQAYAEAYKHNKAYGGVSLQDTLKLIEDAIKDDNRTPIDKAYYEAYQRGFKDALRIP